MTSNIDRRRRAVETLSNHQNRFAVFVALLTNKRDVCRDRYVARHLLPREVKVVDAKPHVLATAGHTIRLGGLVKVCGPDVEDRANVSMTIEDPDCFRIGLCR